MTRVATEFHLRSFDLLTQLEEEITDGPIVATLIHDQLKTPRRKGGGSLTRVDVAAFAPTSRRPVRSGRLEKEQLAIAVAGTGLLLAGLRALRAFWGDLTRGLVYTANVKHVTNTDPVANRWMVDDSERVPVSVLTLSRSSRLPYETMRRHADDLVRDGIGVRAGRRGLFIPNSFIRRIPSGPVLIHRLVTDFLAELRRAGVKV